MRTIANMRLLRIVASQPLRSTHTMVLKEFSASVLLHTSEIIAMLKLSAKNSSRERCGCNRPFCTCSKTGCQLSYIPR
jgi:hypothetical protein